MPASRPGFATRAHLGPRSTVENLNRRTRRWLPRDTDPATISNAELKAICGRLNATPRRCLGWRTPAEVFRDGVLNHHA